MHYFQYRNGELLCENVPLSRISAEVGTPVYVYSEQTLERHVRAFASAFRSVPHLICYAVKANSNLTILRRFADWGLGFDIVSAGELFRVKRAGASTNQVIFSGVGKTENEVRLALESDILFFNIESTGEIDLIRRVARDLQRRARVSIRTNPGIDAQTHPYISTGLKENKFGVAIDEARELYSEIAKMPEIDVVGIACHIGSQITQIEPFQEALSAIRHFIVDLKAAGVGLQYLDFGGGLGISYTNEEPPSPATYATSVINATSGLDLTLVLEPGRVIVGNAGVLVTRVLLRKQQGDKRFIIVDAGMNDLIRPALYGSQHQLWPVREQTGLEIADVVGPVCESADFIAQNREIPVLDRGDLLAVMTAGAYGFTLSSNYNSRPRAAEVLVHNSAYSIIRKRESYEDLIRLEE